MGGGGVNEAIAFFHAMLLQKGKAVGRAFVNNNNGKYFFCWVI